MINLSAIRMAYGSRVLIQNGNVQINDGEKVGLVGPNGSGKTTVFRIITGEEEPDEGVLFMDPGTVVGYFSQDTAEMSGTTAIEEVLSGAGEVHTIGKILSELEHRMSDPEGRA